MLGSGANPSIYGTSQRSDQTLHVGGDGAREVLRAAVKGVLKPYFRRMKSLPAELIQGCAGFWGELAGAGLESYAVEGIAHDGVADVGQVNPDLVSTPGFEPQSQQRSQRLAA